MTPKKRRLFWQLYPSYLLIVLIAIVAVTWYASSATREFFLEQTASDLEARARLFESQVARHLDPVNRPVIDQLAKKMGSYAATRITVLLPSGEVVGDSDETPSAMDNHADRTEVREAIRNGLGHSVRFSRTLKKNLMYVASAVKKDGRIIGVVRTAIPLSAIDRALEGIEKKIVLWGVIIALFATLVSLFVSRRITRPIEEIRKWSTAIAGGDFKRKPEVKASEEMEALSMSLAHMAEELREQLDMVVRQRNEIQAMFASMAEGVFALNMDGHIISMNRAAEQLLACRFEEVKGRSIQEVARNSEMQRFVQEALSSAKPLERDIIISSLEGVVSHCHGSSLKDSEDRQIGVIVVMNDVTRLRRLENVRREFVANVSHEIKTPITAIKGFVETLSDGALKNAEDAARFLKIIDSHVNRLEAIVEDLLNLSRVEQGTEEGSIEKDPHTISDILNTAMQICRERARMKGITMDSSCPESIRAKVNPALIEQAVVNLLDNAIKYSPEGSPIRVEVTQGTGEVQIKVHDQGCGISKPHLPRIFERFYRVDKARSRQMGGTGLGLAIVKHIAEAHAGRVSVESTPGKGSTFTIHLPMA